MDVADKKRLVEAVLAGTFPISAAAEIGNVDRSTIWRWIRRYQKTGNLDHGLTGRASNHSPRRDKTEIVALATGKYQRFNLSHMAELLEEREGLTVSRETLRIWLSRPKKHKRPKHRMRRIPSENFGDMLQIDGSFHHWFGETETCMMNIVDDATKIAEISFDQEETIDSACRCAWRWVKKYGVPKSFYADGRNMYHWLERKGKDNFFTTLCRLLSIRVITAYSGQAKGRVERANGVHQDRLVPLMALDGIGTIKEANQYAKSYMAKHNRKFRMKQAGTNTHRPLPEWVKSMDDVFFIEEERTIGNDWTVSYNGKTYQIPKQSHYPPAKSKITLKITISGRITTSYRGCNLNLQ